ncbi:hypothetical protein Ddc_13674 [Ditylenchus destructor]|nr:hypothetical protein Ddc_13674 [Ditylenchus destructor]
MTKGRSYQVLRMPEILALHFLVFITVVVVSNTKAGMLNTREFKILGAIPTRAHPETDTVRLLSPRGSDWYITRPDPSGDWKVSFGPNPGLPEAVTPGRIDLCRPDRYQSPCLTERKRLVYHTPGSERRLEKSIFVGRTGTHRLVSPRGSDWYITRPDPSGDWIVSFGPNPGLPEAVTPGRIDLCRPDRYQSPCLTERKRLVYHTPGSERRLDFEAAFGDGIEELDGIEYNHQFRGLVALEKDGQKVRKNCKGVKRIEVVDGKTRKRIVLVQIDQLYEANNGFGKLYVELDLY